MLSEKKNVSHSELVSRYDKLACLFAENVTGLVISRHLAKYPEFEDIFHLQTYPADHKWSFSR